MKILNLLRIFNWDSRAALKTFENTKTQFARHYTEPMKPVLFRFAVWTAKVHRYNALNSCLSISHNWSWRDILSQLYYQGVGDTPTRKQSKFVCNYFLLKWGTFEYYSSSDIWIEELQHFKLCFVVVLVLYTHIFYWFLSLTHQIVLFSYH